MNESKRMISGWARIALVAAVAVIAAAPLVPTGALPFANVDEYTIRPFASDFWGALTTAWDEGALGRFRPLYWLFEGGLGAVTGDSATILHVGRLLFLAAAVAIQVRVARRLGAGWILSSALALVVAWSSPALETWMLGGPAEAFGQPLALACTLVALSADTPRRVVLAGALGLAACLAKESYAVWTGATLAVCGAWTFTHRERERAVFFAAGAALQLTPAAIAMLRVPDLARSYPREVVTTYAGAGRDLLTTALGHHGALLLLAVPTAAALALRLSREGVRRWGLEDWTVVVVVVAVAAITLGLGMTMPRYHLPLAAALALLIARGGSALAGSARSPLLAAASAALVLVGVAGPMGARAYYATRAETADVRAEERLRELLAESFVRGRPVRMFWPPRDVERATGALAHLQWDGVRGTIQLVPCEESASSSWLELMRPYSRPVPPDARVVVATACPGAFAMPREQVEELALPGDDGPWPGFRRTGVRERAIALGP